MTYQDSKDSRYETEQVEDINTDLDPRLQRAILQDRSGRPLDAALGQESAEGRVLIDVICKLKDPSQPVPGLNVGRVIGNKVTGSVDIADVDAVRQNPNITSMKAARPVKPELKFSVPEVRGSQSIIQAGLPAGSPEINGSDVVVGIVDYGCDFVHQNFRNPDGTTRLLFLWDQGTGKKTEISPDGFPYGREFDSKTLNGALASANPYQALAYDPGSASHGTHVMDTAAGNGRATGMPGVAPHADLIFVQLLTDDFAPNDNFGNSRRLLEAIDYIFEKASSLGKSAVVNLSLGTNGGPHDGTNLVEEAIDELLDTPGRAVVIAASNSWEDRIHASGRILPNTRHVLRWEISATDFTDNEVEIWYGGNSELNVRLLDPSGASLGSFPLGTTTKVRVGTVQVGTVFHRQNDPNNNDHQIDIILSPGLPGGTWSIVLEAVGSQPVDFHAWIERDDAGASRFSIVDTDTSHTIGSISCGKKTIVVGSYDATVPGRTISSFSAQGPTRDGRQKPEVSAPGHGIVAARSLSQSVTQKWGTSMAAPHVSGLIALLMQAAPQAMNVDQIRTAVVSVARRDPPPGTQWQARYGAGRIDAAASVRSIFGPSPVAVAPPVFAAQPELAASGKSNGKGDAFLEQAVASLVENSAHSKLRLRLEIEVEPISSSV